ncbi:LLM class flavin-dependent oxidoreductase [Streptomyces sp. NPDC012473]|uniref:LLM class flavin-dependent oxidoreductase n=1 Tax=Streptomyces sp. NPDC012473 TaxID=3156676 RepID=UPI0034110F30
MLGTAVTPLGWENPLRLAEDLAMVDVLSGGRLNPGISVGPSMFYDRVKEVLCPETADAEDFGYGRVERLLDLVRTNPPPPPTPGRASKPSPTECRRTHRP